VSRRFHIPIPRAILAGAFAGALVAAPVAVIASHQFTDVPDFHTFHDDIDAIADAGLTYGCGGGNYCPDDNITRGEMAAFLNRLGALRDQDPVVNADEIDDLETNQLVNVRTAYVETPQVIETNVFTGLTGLTVDVTLPVDGYIIARFGAESVCTGADVYCTVRILADGVAMQPDDGGNAFDGTDNNTETNESYAALSIERYRGAYASPIAAGTYTITVQAALSSGSTADFRLDDMWLTVWAIPKTS
jgi:hypothetical protein